MCSELEFKPVEGGCQYLCVWSPRLTSEAPRRESGLA